MFDLCLFQCQVFGTLLQFCSIVTVAAYEKLSITGHYLAVVHDIPLSWYTGGGGVL